jgi:hypothetical protein
MAIQKKSLIGSASAKRKAGGSSPESPAAKPAESASLVAAKRLAVAKLATAKLSTAKLTTRRKLS